MPNISGILSSMTLEEKASQMMIVGFDGLDLPEKYARWLEEYGLGGIILFDRNVSSPSRLLNLTEEAQRRNAASRVGLPLTISIDQEGGTVSRLTSSLGYTHMPSNMALGSVDREELTYEAAKVLATEMVAVGINWNLAPILDINDHPTNSMIGVRSYGPDPSLVGRHGASAIEGFQAGGLLTCGKHFPGHGTTGIDSHYHLPIIAHERSRLENVDLDPFRMAIEAGVDSLMTAHVLYPALDSKWPATMSPAILNDLLRQRMGFGGIICSDCLEMKAITDNYSPDEVVMRSINAGVDMLLVSHRWTTQNLIFKAIISLVKKGDIDEQRIDESVRRVIKMKRELKTPRPKLDVIGTSAHLDVASEIAQKGLAVIWGHDQLPPSKKLIFVIPAVEWWIQTTHTRDLLRVLFDRLELFGYELTIINCQANLEDLCIEDVAKAVNPNGSVVFLLANASNYPQQSQFIVELARSGVPVVACARRTPYDLIGVREALAGIVSYDDSPAMQWALAEALAGRLKSKGIPPVRV